MTDVVSSSTGTKLKPRVKVVGFIWLRRNDWVCPPNSSAGPLKHSTVTLTMDRYSHVRLLDLNSTLESLPAITAPESQTMRSTVITDDATDFGCTNGWTSPAEIRRFQPLKP